jgi:membrane protein
VLLLWIYYSAQILFFGAEVTQVLARRRGARIEPDERAVALSDTDRHKQGIVHDDELLAALERRSSQSGHV